MEKGKNWCANISVKCCGKMDENHAEKIKNCSPDIKRLLWTTGEWDWKIELQPCKDAAEALEKAGELAWKLRSWDWIGSTYTWWSKEV